MSDEQEEPVVRKKKKKKKKRLPEYQPLAGSDFTAPPEPKEQAIALIFGMAGHGKTTLGLDGAPGPVAFYDIDQRGYHAAKKARRKGKMIHHLDVEFPKNFGKLSDEQLKKLATAQMDRIRKNVDVVVRESQKGNVRTAVIDTATELCTLATLSVTGRADKKKDDFGKSTSIMQGLLIDLIRTFREGEANLIMLARAKEIWHANKPTGKFTYRGEGLLEYEADWAGHIRLKKDKKTKLYTVQKHELEITKAGIDLAELGAVYDTDDWEDWGPFVYACVQNYPGTSPDQWR